MVAVAMGAAVFLLLRGIGSRHASTRAPEVSPAPEALPAAKASQAEAPAAQAAAVTRESILDTVASEIAPPEHAYESELTPDADPKNEIARAKERARDRNELYRESARAQHEMLTAMRKLYDEKPELRRNRARIKELSGVFEATKKNSSAYQEALKASLAARETYLGDMQALRAAITNAAAASAPPTPDRFALQARAAESKAAYEACNLKLAEVERGLMNDPAWKAAQEEAIRLQEQTREMLAQDESIRGLKQRSDELERKKKELAKERGEKPGKAAAL